MRRAGLVFALAVLAAMPVGAGASGHASLAMLAFAGLFLLANAVLRPGSVRLDAPGALAQQAMTAAAFAALLVGLGQTLRALARLDGGVDLFGWVFAAAWAVVLARLVWPPRMIDRAADGAEAALRQVHRAGERARRAAPAPPRAAPPPASPSSGPAEPHPQGGATPDAPSDAPHDAPSDAPHDAPSDAPPDTPATVPDREADPAPLPDPALAPALSALDALPQEGAGLDDIRAALADLEADAPPDRAFAALLARSGPGHPPRDRRALLLHATDPALGTRRPGQREAAAAFEAIVAAADAEALDDFTTLARALLEAAPEARGDLPDIARLIEIADQIETPHEEAAEALVSLAHRIEDLAFEAGEGADA